MFFENYKPEGSLNAKCGSTEYMFYVFFYAAQISCTKIYSVY